MHLQVKQEVEVATQEAKGDTQVHFLCTQPLANAEVQLVEALVEEVRDKAKVVVVRVVTRAVEVKVVVMEVVAMAMAMVEVY